jgi:phosphoglycerate dehydrogenase-like enzyme
MQILMTKASHERVAARLAAMAPDAEVVTIHPGGGLEIDGRTVAADVVSPEVGWISIDSLFSGLMEPLADLAVARKVRWMQVAAAGLDRPIFTTLMAGDVRLSKGAAQANPIAEYVVAHAFSLLHPIAEQGDLQAKHDWKRVNFREIGGSRWMLVGYGAIGHEIAKRIRPFGVDITTVRRSAVADELVDRSVTLADAPALLPQTDVVVLACALNDETRNLANAAFFAAMKPGAILINIARGGVLDETALRDALDRDQPGHAVLDVFETEPLPTASWIWDHPKVRVTAHTSNAGDGNMARGDDQFLANLKRYRAGEAPHNEAHKSEVGL